MSISKADARKMKLLAEEGKQISKIVSEDFPELDYWEVYFIVYNAGGGSSLGIKRTITNRINTMVSSTSKKEKLAVANELNELVLQLYMNHKKNTEKLKKIRAALNE
jgi:hypothetical protein